MSSLIPKSNQPADAISNRRKIKQIPPVSDSADSVNITDGKSALSLISYVTEKSINGIGPLCSAEKLADEYMSSSRYASNAERIDALIKWETRKNFTSGFITGLGGILTLPVAIPAAFGASWVIQARMAAAVAKISGQNISSDPVKTFVILCLAGDACKEILKDAGIKVGNGLARTVIQKIPGQLLIEINKKVGFRLVTKAGEKGALNLMKVVPIAGGVIGGAFDAGACRIVGMQAKKLFGFEGTNP